MPTISRLLLPIFSHTRWREVSHGNSRVAKRATWRPKSPEGSPVSTSRCTLRATELRRLYPRTSIGSSIWLRGNKNNILYAPIGASFVPDLPTRLAGGAGRGLWLCILASHRNLPGEPGVGTRENPLYLHTRYERRVVCWDLAPRSAASGVFPARWPGCAARVIH